MCGQFDHDVPAVQSSRCEFSGCLGKVSTVLLLGTHFHPKAVELADRHTTESLDLSRVRCDAGQMVTLPAAKRRRRFCTAVTIRLLGDRSQGFYMKRPKVGRKSDPQPLDCASDAPLFR